MAQYIPFAPNVEVNGETVLATVHSFPEYLRKFAIEILEDNGIVDPKPGIWYKQIGWLNSFRDIAARFGSNALFEIGKAIPSNARFPENIKNLHDALSMIDIAYHMNHRNGEIGFYKLVSHDKTKKIVQMHCRNPYPCDFDRGILTTMASRFKPGISVYIDKEKPCRKDGDDESWYYVLYK